MTRGQVLAGGAVAVTGGVVLATLPDFARSAPSERQDAEILNFALLLERVQAAFYAEAVRRGRLDGELLTFARTVGAQERAHEQYLTSALGSAAAKAPRLDFGDDTGDPRRFARSAVRLEDLGVKAYVTQVANLTPRALTQALRVSSVEARHASWIRDLTGLDPAPAAAEPLIAPATVTKTLQGSGYVR